MLRLPRRGARWTREEDEELVAAVRAGADLAVIAEQHGRTRSAIVSRLLRMIPSATWGSKTGHRQLTCVFACGVGWTDQRV